MDNLRTDLDVLKRRVERQKNDSIYTLKQNNMLKNQVIMLKDKDPQSIKNKEIMI